MKIDNWVKDVSLRYKVSSFYTIHELCESVRNFLPCANKKQVLDEFYAMYVFNTKQDVIIIATSVDGKRFSSLTYYDQGGKVLEMKNKKTISLFDAGVEFCKTTHAGASNIEIWENFYLKNFVSKKLKLKDVDLEILENFVNMKTNLNIETITESYIDESSFHSGHLIAIDGFKPQIMIIASSLDGENFLNYFATKIDEDMSIGEYSKILSDFGLPSQEKEV